MSTGSSQTGRMQQTGSPGAPAATALPLQSHGSADLMELEALLAHREVVQCHCHHWLDGHELEQAPGGGDRQGSLASCSRWGSQRVRHDRATELNWTEVHGQLFGTITLFYVIYNFNEEITKNAMWDIK